MSLVAGLARQESRESADPDRGASLTERHGRRDAAGIGSQGPLHCANVSFTVRLTWRVWPAASKILTVIVAVTFLPFLAALLIS